MANQKGQRPKVHAKGVELVGPGMGLSICGVYRLDLTNDLKLVTCKNCLRLMSNPKTAQ